MSKWIAEFELEDGDTMPEHMDLNYMGARIDFYCRPMWTPVSERLPEKTMSCLVSVGKLHLTQIAVYSDLMGTINHKIFYQGDYGHNNFKDITQYVNAWMPLPEPYKAENEEKNEN